MSSFAGSLTRSSVDADDESGNSSVFERDIRLADGHRAFLDSDIWYGQSLPTIRQLRGFAEERDADGPNDPLMTNLVGSVSINRSLTLTGVNAAQIKAAAPAVPATPEPATLALFGSGLCGVALTVRRKFRHH